MKPSLCAESISRRKSTDSQLELNFVALLPMLDLPFHSNPTMALSADVFGVLDDFSSRLAGESMLAQPGRDDGLIPVFSLLSDFAQASADEPTLTAALTAVRQPVEALLDEAHPFDEPTLGLLRRLVNWLPGALVDARQGRPITPFASTAQAAGPSTSAAAPTAAKLAETVDVLLDLNLEENRDLLIEFHAEALDHLQQIEAALLSLEHQLDDPEALNAIFRSFHTIKGVAGFLRLVPMHTLAHEVESLLDLARKQKLRLNSEIITQILLSRDALQTLVGQITNALEHGRLPDQIVPVSHLIEAVRHFITNDVPAAPAAAPAAVAAPSPPPLAPVVPLEFPTAPAAPAPPPQPAPAQPAPVPTPTAAEPARPAAAVNPAASGAATKSASASTVRVNTEKLDSLMDVVGELVIVQSQLIESSRAAIRGDGVATLQRNVAQLSRITKELQHTAMSVRMIPVKPTFQKMERLARDLARDCGKKVAFLVTGEDTELDRTVVEEIGDPLIHMVRNALDHGLEAPAERIAHGKPESGTVHLKAYHEGSHIVIELSDDGRGIDPDRIISKARKIGLVPAGVEMERSDILNLIFAPGFSTAETVTAVSGRGVGMDVVRRNIERLRGKIEIETAVGTGSTFRIKLPLTMAIIDGLVVRVGADRFILPSTSVKMALRPVREAFITVHGTGEALDLRGKIIPLHRLHRQFSIPNAVENPWEAIVVIVEVSGKTKALLVDELLSKQEVVIKNLGSFLQELKGVAGGAILGDGNIALILDPGSLFQAA
jgi:two-component system chemotaxis sensor kinase CheA